MRNIIFTFLFASMSLIALGFSAYLFATFTTDSKLPNIPLAMISLLGSIIYGFVAGNNITTIIKEESI